MNVNCLLSEMEERIDSQSERTLAKFISYADVLLMWAYLIAEVGLPATLLYLEFLALLASLSNIVGNSKWLPIAAWHGGPRAVEAGLLGRTMCCP